MSPKEQTHINDKASSKQQSPKPTTENLDMLSQQLTHPATLIQPARIDSGTLSPRQVLLLQDTIGNRAVQRLLLSKAEEIEAISANNASTSVPAVIQRQRPVAEAAPPAVMVTDDDRAEFGHLRLRTGRADLSRFAKVEDYVTYRDGHFGSRAEYDAIRAVADAEWDENGPIRNHVGQKEDSTDKKKALYRWLRLEYRRAGIDTAPEIVALMRQGMTPELQAIVGRVRALHPGLRTGGFVARPIKHTDVGYKLGTLSEHGTGRAFDIKPQSDNPQIPVGSWQVIERLVGHHVDRRLRRWQTDPAALWQDVHDLNQEYQAEVTSRVSEIHAARKADGKDPDHPNPLNKVLADSWLRDRAIEEGLSFFTLTQDLVLAMHGEGLVWGVTLSTPDLHHFELRRGRRRR